MEFPKLLSIFTLCLISLTLASRRGLCNCEMKRETENKTVEFTSNGCSQHFRPTYEILVLPLHPGTGSPLVKTQCVCICRIDFRQGSFFNG